MPKRRLLCGYGDFADTFDFFLINLTLNTMMSLHIHIIPTTSLRHMLNPHPRFNLISLPIILNRLQVRVTVISTNLQHPLLVQERPAQRLDYGQILGLLFPQETAHITATVGGLVGIDGNCAIFTLSGTWCRHRYLAIPLRWI